MSRRGVLAIILLLFAGGIFAQTDSVAMRLQGLKELYEHKKISLEKYQELSKQLLRPAEVAQPAAPAVVIPDAVFDTATVARTEEYCMLVGTAKLFSTKVSIEIDYGQKKKLYGDNRFKDSGGKLVAFDSMVDALNFMNSKGWELYAAYPMASQMGSAYHYLLKRKIVSK
ncbi:MAG TPA: hypothetical protein VK174_14245 [Chitinophagales bacterium]|nr:hypothetical protein [Chitinophagales bacterium]